LRTTGHSAAVADSGEPTVSTVSSDSAVYWDPYDVRLGSDPYPALARLREEAPLYYNEQYDFYALSRYADLEQGLADWETFSSARGSLLELIKSGIEMPPGTLVFEDPRAHDIHRRLLVRVFTPRRVAALEPQVREFCRQLRPDHGRWRADADARDRHAAGHPGE
jgi:cytochrome P450